MLDDCCHTVLLFNISVPTCVSCSRCFLFCSLVKCYFFYPQGKTKPYVNGTPPTYFREDLKPLEKSPILKISAAQPIPSNRIDNSNSCSWVAGSFR